MLKIISNNKDVIVGVVSPMEFDEYGRVSKLCIVDKLGVYTGLKGQFNKSFIKKYLNKVVLVSGQLVKDRNVEIEIDDISILGFNDHDRMTLESGIAADSYETSSLELVC